MNPMSTGPIDDAEDDRPERAPIAQRVLELLAADDDDLPQAAQRRSLARSPLERRPARRTRLRGCRGRSAGGVRRACPAADDAAVRRSRRSSRRARRLPASRGSRRARSAPRPRSRRTMVRTARVLMTSSPLVGSSSSTFCGSWTSARARATLVRSPCEKPAVRRSAMALMSSRSSSSSRPLSQRARR